MDTEERRLFRSAHNGTVQSREPVPPIRCNWRNRETEGRTEL